MTDQPEFAAEPERDAAAVPEHLSPQKPAAQPSRAVLTPVSNVPYRGDLLAERKAGSASLFRQVAFHGRVLRAGWGVVLFCLLFSYTLVVETLLIQHFRVVVYSRTWFMTPHDVLNPLVALAAVVLATVCPSLLEQRHPNDYGFRGSPWKPLAIGIGTGFAVVAATCVAMRASHLLLPQAPVLNFTRAAKYAMVWGGIALIIALLEELLTRGYLQYGLTRGLAFLYRRFLGVRSGVAAAFWTSAVLLSGVFTLLYVSNDGQTSAGLACIFVMGLLYSLSLWRTGNLWWAVGFHTAWDFTQGYVFGQWNGGLPVRDHLFTWAAQQPLFLSGGKAGLDGTPLVYLTLAAAFATLLLTMKKQVVYPELWALAEEQAGNHHHQHMTTLPDPDRA